MFSASASPAPGPLWDSQDRLASFDEPSFGACGAALGVSQGVVNPLEAVATLGSEFTFFADGMQNPRHGLPGYIIRNSATEDAQDELAAAMLAKCEPCTAVLEDNKYGVSSYNITHPDGFWINVDTDPSCVETQMKPMTLKEYEEHAPQIQDLLFDTAAQIGLKPDTELGNHRNVPFRMGGEATFILDCTAPSVTRGI